VQTVDEYLAAQPEATQVVLRRVRAVIHKALPRAEESISYAIPTLKLGGAAVIYFAGWKKHFSIYPVGDAVRKACKAELAGYQVAKGTIRFPLDEPVPAKLIAKIAKLRAAEVTAKKPAARSPSPASRRR
jgi:uncharacterized protein YdhG (YjbR/CyaY superfamily)